MRYNVLFERLQNLINYKPSQTEVGKILGLAQTAMSGRANRNSNFTDEEIELIEKYYNINLLQNNVLCDNEHIILDYYPDVFGSCGNGVFQFSRQKETLAIPQKAFFTRYSPAKKYFVINAYGNSMEPFIYDKDKLIIESYDGEQIIDNRPYVFSYNDEIFIKRLAKNVNQLVIMPDNKEYDIIKLTGSELQNVNIIGQIVGLMRDLM